MQKRMGDDVRNRMSSLSLQPEAYVSRPGSVIRPFGSTQTATMPGLKSGWTANGISWTQALRRKRWTNPGLKNVVHRLAISVASVYGNDWPQEKKYSTQALATRYSIPHLFTLPQRPSMCRYWTKRVDLSRTYPFIFPFIIADR